MNFNFKWNKIEYFNIFYLVLCILVFFKWKIFFFNIKHAINLKKSLYQFLFVCFWSHSKCLINPFWRFLFKTSKSTSSLSVEVFQVFWVPLAPYTWTSCPWKISCLLAYLLLKCRITYIYSCCFSRPYIVRQQHLIVYWIVEPLSPHFHV